MLAYPEGSNAGAQAQGYAALKEYLIGLTGLGYYRDKDEVLVQRIHGRIVALGMRNPVEYLEFIRADRGRDELDALIDEIAVGETYFFRNPSQFDALKTHVLPDRIKARGDDRSLRIWSAGCASGAEPYSVAILLEREWPEILRAWTVDITGTDICGRRLDRARQATFSNWELRGLPDDLRALCFDHRDGLWHLRPKFTKRVAFQRQNLKDILDVSPGTECHTFDIILCRNVLIYFDVELIRAILARLRDMLAEGGWLIVGHSEPFLEISHFLTPVSVEGTTLYRRLDGAVQRTEVPVLRPPAPTGQPMPYGPSPGVQPLSGPTEHPPAVGPVIVPKPAPAPISTDTLSKARQAADAGDWLRAAQACDAHISGHPLDPAGYFILALVHEHRGEPSMAFDALKRVIYLDRTHALAHFHIGRLHQQAGDRQSARRYFANACDLVAALPSGTLVDGGDGLDSDELAALAARHLEGVVP